MAKIININRDAKTGKVTFDEVSIDPTENVCFANLDPQDSHWPDLASNPLGPYKSANSSECVVTPNPKPVAGKPPVPVTYKCQLHEGEGGTINVYAALAVGADAPQGKLANATKGTPIPEQQVVQGGQPPYTVNRSVVRIDGNVIQGWAGLQLNNPTTTQGKTGITVSGTPTSSGTYTFALDVSDKMGRNLQQLYTMLVT